MKNLPNHRFSSTCDGICGNKTEVHLLLPLPYKSFKFTNQKVILQLRRTNKRSESRDEKRKFEFNVKTLKVMQRNEDKDINSALVRKRPLSFY